MAESPLEHRGKSRGVVAICAWLLRYALHRWRAMLGVLCAILLKSLLDLLKPWPMKLLIDRVLDPQPSATRFGHFFTTLPGAAMPMGLAGWCVAGTVVIFLLGWAVGTTASIAGLNFGQRLAYDLALDLFGHLQRLSLRFHARKSVGDSIRRVTSDSACVTTIVRDALLPLVGAVMSLVMMFAVLCGLNWMLAMLSLGVIPMLALVLHRYARPMEETSYLKQEAESEIYGTVEQTLSAMPVIQAFTMEREASRLFRQGTDRTLSATILATRVQLKFKVLSGLSTVTGTAVILAFGGREVLAGRMSIGSLLVFITYLASFYAPIETLTYTASTIQFAAGSARRVLEVFDTEHDVKDSPNAVSISSGRVKGHVTIENVTFGYEAGRPVLSEISLDVQRGETVAIVGPTGAGKSTMAGLAPRFFDPWSGRVLLDGRDLRSLRLADLRRNVSVVLQEAFLFPRTVAENIAYGRPGASRAEIEAAAQAANAAEFIERLPQKYDTILGERGATLSGGQRQRIGVARALLREAPILVLDEPTSALDAGTEGLLISALERLRGGKTCLIIAHRLSTIRHADMIVVLDHGRIVERGKHEELSRSGGLYARMHHRFVSGSADPINGLSPANVP